MQVQIKYHSTKTESNRPLHSRKGGLLRICSMLEKSHLKLIGISFAISLNSDVLLTS